MNRNFNLLFLIITLLFINSVYCDPIQPPKYIGNLLEKEYNVSIALVSDYLESFEKIGNDKYDLCSSSIFKCKDGYVTEVHLSYNGKGKSYLKSDRFGFTKVLDKIVISLFTLNDDFLSEVKAKNVSLLLCKEASIRSLEKSIEHLYFESTSSQTINLDKFSDLTNFVYYSSTPLDPYTNITFTGDLEFSNDFQAENWEIISSNMPPLNHAKIKTLKLRLLKPVSFNNDNSFYDITTFYLYDYFRRGEPIDFPESILNKTSSNIEFFGTDFKFKNVSKQINFGESDSLSQLHIVNADGFVFAPKDPIDPNDPIGFPFSGFPKSLEGFTFSRNTDNYKLPNFVELFSDTKINYLTLSDNGFTGDLKPIDIKTLTVLDLSNNEFTGSVGDWICDRKYKSLKLSNNKLIGDLPLCAQCYLSDLSSITSQNYFQDPICETKLINSISLNRIDDEEDGYEYTLSGKALVSQFNSGNISIVSDPQMVWEEVEFAEKYTAKDKRKISLFSFHFNTNSPFDITLPVNGAYGNPEVYEIDVKYADSKIQLSFTGSFFSHLDAGIEIQAGDFVGEKVCNIQPNPSFSGFIALCDEKIKSTKNITVKADSKESINMQVDFSIEKNLKVCRDGCQDQPDGCDFDTGFCKCAQNCYHSNVTSINRGICVPIVQDGRNSSRTQCLCTANKWFGEYCQNANCTRDNNCTSVDHGTCDVTTATCKCKPGYAGADCSRSASTGSGSGGGKNTNSENNNNNNNNNNTDGNGGSIIPVIVILVVFIAAAYFGYKKYMSSSSSSTTENGVKFKSLNTKVQDDDEDEEGRLSLPPIRKTHEDDE